MSVSVPVDDGGCSGLMRTNETLFYLIVYLFLQFNSLIAGSLFLERELKLFRIQLCTFLIILSLALLKYVMASIVVSSELMSKGEGDFGGVLGWLITDGRKVLKYAYASSTVHSDEISMVREFSGVGSAL